MLSVIWINMIEEGLCSGKGMVYFKVGNNVENLRAGILQHSNVVSLAAWAMVTNCTSAITPAHRSSLLIICTKHGSVNGYNLYNLCLV